jgi:polyhydroxyalkanoate synthesis regulator phasin
MEAMMGKRKRTTRRPSGLVGRAVSAGRRALKEAESRVPPDLRRQVERRLKDADKNARAAIKTLQAQVKRASTRADVNSVLKRIDGLTRQARQIAQGAGTRTATTRRRATSTAKRTATRTRKAATTTRRRTAPRRTAPASVTTTARATAPRRRPATRRARPAEPAMGGMPEIHTVPMAPEGGEMGGSGES